MPWFHGTRWRSGDDNNKVCRQRAFLVLMEQLPCTVRWETRLQGWHWWWGMDLFVQTSRSSWLALQNHFDNKAGWLCRLCSSYPEEFCQNSVFPIESRERYNTTILQINQQNWKRKGWFLRAVDYCCSAAASEVHQFTQAEHLGDRDVFNNMWNKAIGNEIWNKLHNFFFIKAGMRVRIHNWPKKKKKVKSL